MKVLRISSYREDIDGLRAIAVLSVLFYHMGFESFGGGFVGVDVFFVISGYLIVLSIITDLSNNQFSFMSFYNRRIRRILPSLLTVLLLSFSVGFVILPPSALVELSNSVLSSILFVSNFYFQSEAGYFDTAAELKPLLHTWSLSIEEQFYLVVPLLAVFSRSLKVFLLIIVLIVFSSLLLLLVYSDGQSIYFFFPQFRAWELGVGALCAFSVFFSKDNVWVKSEVLANAGLLLTLIAIFFLSSKEWPNVLALLPTIGAALVILFSRSNVILKNYFLVFVGKRSYSIYLAHYPIISFSTYYFGNNFSLYEILFILVMIVVFSHLLYELVERRFKDTSSRHQKLSVFSIKEKPNQFMFLLTSVLLVLCYFVISTDGYHLRDKTVLLEQRLLTIYRQHIVCDEMIFRECVDKAPKAKVVLLGDSNAYHFSVGAAKSSPNGELISLTTGGCMPLARFTRLDYSESQNSRCINFNEEVNAGLTDEFAKGRVAVVSAAWLLYIYGDELYSNVPKSKLATFGEGLVLVDEFSKVIPDEKKFDYFSSYLLSMASELSSKFDQVIFLGPLPPQPYAVKSELMLQLNGHRGTTSDVFYEYAKPVLDVFSRIEEEGLPNVSVVYPHIRLCDQIMKGRCVGYHNGEHYYGDETHVSAVGQFVAYAELFSILKSLD